MEMTMRWYGSKFDTVTLKQIRQTAYATGVITMLYDKQPGELWTQEEIHALKEEVEASGLHISGIESVNVSDAIKTGSADRDKDIDAYIKSLENLGKRISTWYATTSCRYSTGQEPSWQEEDRTAPLFWHTHRKR